MPPPIQGPTGNGPSALPGVNLSNHDGTPSADPVFRSAPTLQLRTDLRNPIHTTTPVTTLGEVRDAIINDFIGGQLRVNGRGAQIVQQLGSFPGYRHPNYPLAQWNPDQKPDFNIIGETEVILRQLQPMMGWDNATLEENLARARRGMVYFNQAIETPVGPVPFKMGILDTEVWRRGSFYYDMRASLLPIEETYRFLSGPGETPTITREEFVERHRQVEADMMGRTIRSFLFSSSFSAEQLMRQRYRHNFGFYEAYRVFDWFKGAKQRAKYQNTSQGDIVPRILVPGVQRWLNQNSNLMEVRHEGVPATADQITPENFSNFTFHWKNSLGSRLLAWPRRFTEIFRINLQNVRQTLLNISSNGTSRPTHHSIDWLSYGKRKFGRFVGIENQNHPRVYSQESSRFLGTDNITPEQQRLGVTENPIDQMIILAGYPPEDERHPETWDNMVRYTEAEISKGARPNILIKGNNPSKFTFPIRGVPAIAYRFIDGLRTEGIKTIVVVGPPDVGVTFEAFQNHFAEEIQERGKNFIYVDTGLGRGGFTVNLQQGLNRLPNRDGIAILSYGDTPRVDLHNVAHHPYRHSLDYIFGANGRDMVLDFMGMNAHYQADIDGVGYGSKEGNVQAVRSRFPIQFWQEIFENRKSMLSGPLGKVYIALRYLAVRPTEPWSLRTAPGNLASIAGSLLSPRLGILDIPTLIFGDVLPRSVRNVAHRKGVASARPPWVGMNVEMVEDVFRTQMEWNSDFRATHLDPGGLVDLDGVRDYLVADTISRIHPHPHQEDLERFAREGLEGYRDRIPALENTPSRINNIYLNLRETLLEREATRASDEKLGITHETLRRLGFDPETLPFTEEGEVNQEWLERVIPQKELESFLRAFQAYENRGQHAKGLEAGFQERLSATQPNEESQRVEPRIERFVLKELSAEPERMRGLVLEWGFDRIESAVLEQAKRRFGEHAEELAEISRYFEQSTAGNCDTRLRRVLLGFKAVDVLRRYQSHLAPAEFQSLYPHLVELIEEAREAAPQGEGWRRGPIPFLSRFFQIAQRTADQIYIRKVGESPPSYRARGRFTKGLPHSNGRSPVLRENNQPANGTEPISLAEILSRRGEVRRVDSPVYLQRDLNLMARRLNILPSRIPELIAAASGAHRRGQLPRISGEAGVAARGSSGSGPSIPEIPATPGQRMSLDRLLAWTQSTQGQDYLDRHGHRLTDRFQNRLIESGPGLGLGIASLLGAEYLADHIGLDPIRNSQERFMFVVGASHLVNTGAGSIQEVLLNRYYHRMPYDFVTNRMVNGGSEAALQYSLEARTSMGRALTDSLLRNYGLQGGIGRAVWNGTRGLVTLPIRASWNMGPGLMSSALTDRILSEGILGLEPGSTSRHVIRFGSFFLPDAYQIAFGHRGAALFRTRPFRWGARAFAAGFMADMGYHLYNRVRYGSDGAAARNMIYQRANELHDADRGIASSLLDGAFEMVAPGIAAWWDSVEFDGLSLQPNRYQLQARRELQKYSQNLQQSSQTMVTRLLIQGSAQDRWDPGFYQRIDWSPLEGEATGSSGRDLPVDHLMENLTGDAGYREHFMGLPSHAAQVDFLRREYSGWNLSAEDATNLISQVQLQEWRNQLAQIHHMPLEGVQVLQDHFDESGRLRRGRGASLLRELGTGEEQILAARRVGLALAYLRFQDTGTTEAPGGEAGLRRLARQVGVLDEADNLREGPILEQARRLYAQERPQGFGSLAS